MVRVIVRVRVVVRVRTGARRLRLELGQDTVIQTEIHAVMFFCLIDTYSNIHRYSGSEVKKSKHRSKGMINAHITRDKQHAECSELYPQSLIQNDRTWTPTRSKWSPKWSKTVPEWPLGRCR